MDDYDERCRLLTDAYRVSAKTVAQRKVLLLDDLYRSGATLEKVATSLRVQGHVKGIYVLAFTKTRVRR